MGAPKQGEIGHHLGRSLSEMFARTYVAAKAAVTPAEHEHRWRANEKQMDKWEKIVGARLGEMMADIPEMKDEPAAVRMARELSSRPKNGVDLIMQIILFVPNVILMAGEYGRIAFEPKFRQARMAVEPYELPPGMAAEAWAKGHIDEMEADGFQRFAGLSPQTRPIMRALAEGFATNGEASAMYRYNIIDEARFRAILRRNGVGEESINDFVALTHVPMTGPEALEAFIKGYLGENQALGLWEMGGGRAEDFDVIKKAVGDAIGVEAAARLFTHGKITDADFKQVILHSRINPEFEPMAHLLTNRWLSAFEIKASVVAGVVDSATAAKWLTEDGYPPDQVAALSHVGGTAAAGKAKDATVSVIEASYDSGIIPHAEALAAMTRLGYPAHAAELTLGVVDARRQVSAMNHTISAIRKAFVGGHLSAQGASTSLDAIGVHHGARDAYLVDWGVEKGTISRTLTEAQIGSLMKKQIIRPETAVRKWMTMGYSQEDAGLLAFLNGLPTPNDEPVE